MSDSALLDRFREMFDCDEVRITKPCNRLFLILGWNRRTKKGEWLRNGEPIQFGYLEEKAVASGDTEEELVESAEEYKRVLDGGWRYYFEREGIPWTKEAEEILGGPTP